MSQAAEDLKNLYICGAPGMGKSLCIAKVICDLKEQQGDHDDEEEETDEEEEATNSATSSSSSSSSSSSASTGEKRPRPARAPNSTGASKKARFEEENDENALPKFKVVRLIGPTLSSTDFFTTIARSLGLTYGPGGETAARLVVMSHFTNEAARRRYESNRATTKAFTVDPVTILVVDEIDRAPPKGMVEVLEIMKDAWTSANAAAATPSARSDGTRAPWACNVVVVGLANNIAFPEEVGITCAAQECINTIVFNPYTADQLKSIIRARTR